MALGRYRSGNVGVRGGFTTQAPTYLHRLADRQCRSCSWHGVSAAIWHLHSAVFHRRIRIGRSAPWSTLRCRNGLLTSSGASGGPVGCDGSHWWAVTYFIIGPLIQNLGVDSAFLLMVLRSSCRCPELTLCPVAPADGCATRRSVKGHGKRVRDGSRIGICPKKGEGLAEIR